MACAEHAGRSRVTLEDLEFVFSFLESVLPIQDVSMLLGILMSETDGICSTEAEIYMMEERQVLELQWWWGALRLYHSRGVSSFPISFLP